MGTRHTDKTIKVWLRSGRRSLIDCENEILLIEIEFMPLYVWIKTNVEFLGDIINWLYYSHDRDCAYTENQLSILPEKFSRNSLLGIKILDLSAVSEL